MRKPIEEILDERILLLDGGFGTMVQGYGLDEAAYRGERFRDWERQLRGCNDLLALTCPDVVREIHEKYLAAGADIIETDSFNANAVSLADYGLEGCAYEIARAAAGVARAAADAFTARNPLKPRFVAGSIGPTNRTLSMSADVNDPAARDITFAEMCAAYREQVRGLLDGGADLLLIETVFDTLNAKAALAAVDDECRTRGIRTPVMISGTLSDASGRTLSGQTVEAFYASVAHARPLSVGLNCAYGAKQLLPYLERLAAVAETRISTHPNAGLPNIMGGYDETPAMFAADCAEYMRRGLVDIIGGCCGTTPEHIFELAKIAGDYAPRRLPAPRHITVLSGLEPLRIVPEANFVNIGERTNVAGSAKFARLIREGDYDEALTVARAQVDAGAQLVDVCMDDGLIDGPQAMRHFLNLMASEPEIARVPVMIDSSKWEVLEAGLQVVQGKSVVNSISLKEGEGTFLERAAAIRRYGAAAVVMLFDERGQADTYARKIEVAERAYRLLTEAGFPPEEIVFDPNVLAVATGIEAHDRYALDFIEATRWIKEHLPHAKVSGGVSNLSFAFRGNNVVREAMHSVFLYHAIAAGMDMGIVNPQLLQVYSDIEPALLERVEDVVLCRRADAAERLIDYAQHLRTDTAAEGAAHEEAWRTRPLPERIEYALLRGVTDHIETDTLEAYRELGDPMQVIDRLLMRAMARVGELFGQGKMFLPQVVKSARVMKRAVGVLTPYIEQNAAGRNSAGKVIVATVKGDVHDIGKNIVAVVMACNGYEIRDLGVMVEAQRIVDEAAAWGADAICLSGLITPSLDEMIHVVEEAERRSLHIPFIIGGATTSDLHTAVKIAPCTAAPVIHSRDASENNRILAALLGPDCETYVAEVQARQQRLRDDYLRRERLRDLISVADARIADRARSPHGTARLPRLRHRRRRTLHRLELLLPRMGAQRALPRPLRPPRTGRRSPQTLRRRTGVAAPHRRRTAPHAARRRGNLPRRQPRGRHPPHRCEGTPPYAAHASQPDARRRKPLPVRLHRRPARRRDRLHRRLRPHGRNRPARALRQVPLRGRRLLGHHGQAARRPPHRSLRRSGAQLRAAADVGLRNRRGADAAAGHRGRIPRPAHGLRLPRLARSLAQTRNLRSARRRTDDPHAADGELDDLARRSALRVVLLRYPLFLRRTDRRRTAARLRRTARTGSRNR